MALRAFCSNPSLGGFGGESGLLITGGNSLQRSLQRKKKRERDHSSLPVTEKDCDAFAQIVKELVDNAIDSTRSVSHQSKKQAKRVRVVIEQCEAPVPSSERTDERTAAEVGACTDDADGEANEVLRVTVSDNGCGMADIQACVEAFRTNKAQGKQTAPENMTAGRYGIGLTLCLLHAQRLVQNSCASITSATPEAAYFTKASYVVDTEGDSVRCVRREKSRKAFLDESGTSVSVLVPVRRKSILLSFSNSKKLIATFLFLQRVELPPYTLGRDLQSTSLVFT
jgi:hypothetical protein